MVNSIITSLALFGASATALSVGSAHVINQCNYPVYLCNTPSSGGGYDQQDKTLSPGESWDQQWTELSNGNGWSIKLAKADGFQTNILQYEYTFHNDGIIWYDLSCVDGNPWDKDWEITADNGCQPKQQAYRYATDDAYGMQSCSQDASVTVTICSGESADNGTAVSAGSGPSSSSSSSAAAAPAYSAPASSSADSAPAYSAPEQSSAAPSSTPPATYGYNWFGSDNQGQDYTPTTLATKTTALATNADGVVVVETDVVTVVQTNVVTATAVAYGPSRVKRHQHHEHGHQQHRA